MSNPAKTIQDILEMLMILTPWTLMFASIYAVEKIKAKKLRQSLDF